MPGDYVSAAPGLATLSEVTEPLTDSVGSVSVSASISLSYHEAQCQTEVVKCEPLSPSASNNFITSFILKVGSNDGINVRRQLWLEIRNFFT